MYWLLAAAELGALVVTYYVLRVLPIRRFEDDEELRIADEYWSTF